MKTKTFRKKADARAWAKRIEGDRDQIEALGAPGPKITVPQLVREYEEAWDGKDKSTLPRVRWWGQHFGSLRLTDVTGIEIRKALDGYAVGRAMRGAGFHASSYSRTNGASLYETAQILGHRRS